MLHKRSGHLRRGLAAAGSALPMLRDRLMATDPGLVRLMLAIRGTLAVLLTTIVAIVASGLLKVPPTDFASGVILSMLGPFLTREPTLRQRQRGLLVLTVPAAGVTIATAVLHGYGIAGDSFFLLLVFLCFLLHLRGPRAVGIGLIAVVEAYVGLYLELPPSTLPDQILSVIVAAPITAFACFVVVPVNPAATLRRAVRAVQWRAAQVLRLALRVASDESGRAAARLRRELARLNEAALAADDQLALLKPIGREAVRAGLIELELAAARSIEALYVAEPGPRHRTRLLLHARRMARGRRYHLRPDLAEPGGLRANLVQLGHAAHDLGKAAREMRAATDATAAPSLPPGPLAWRLAARVTLAAALAMAGGMALSPQRWFWAVITVYVVFLNARSRGDTIYKGLQRLGGTLIGIASGLALTMLLIGSTRLQLAGLLLSVFGMFYLILYSYTAGIFCVTMLLGLLYGLFGIPLGALLALRLEETAIGAVAAILVAAFVLPLRTRDQVMRSGRNVLTALVDAVRASREAMAGTPGAEPLEQMRQVDRQVADLRLAMAPLTAGRSLMRRPALERPVSALLDCVHWARALAAASHPRPGAPEAEALAAQIEARLAQLAGMQSASGEEAATAPKSSGTSDEPIQAALQKLSLAVGVLAENLEIGALEGFVLEG